ncbi:hypothetical protein [Streptomyces roseochromogenus]|uniref:Chaplin domain-containing protein n=1 Tax=Streptomyces roseochromogenus subsp. oscitans DS 12.976 TaxID=1352936 RepID=V6KB02_STRRC|nr:hypothetical protein [Streptomyces roseochromogenus]EST29208.1 hypothetical protein M878_20775 [Streptomyces roseochromogenus subsp. oscitans DS 12.976]
MSSIRRAMACTVAGALLTVGGVTLAAPAQAQTQVPAAAAQQSAATVPAGNEGNGNGNENCGLLGLGCLLHGLLGVL